MKRFATILAIAVAAGALMAGSADTARADDWRVSVRFDSGYSAYSPYRSYARYDCSPYYAPRASYDSYYGYARTYCAPPTVVYSVPVYYAPVYAAPAYSSRYYSAPCSSAPAPCRSGFSIRYYGR